MMLYLLILSLLLIVSNLPFLFMSKGGGISQSDLCYLPSETKKKWIELN